MYRFSEIGVQVITNPEEFWSRTDHSLSAYELLRYSLFLGFFAFAGHLFSYTVTGKVWSVWPWIQTTLTVGDGLMSAGMMWIFFAFFPMLASFLIQLFQRKWNDDTDWIRSASLISYAMTPICLAVLFVGVPFLERILAVLGLSTFLYLLYYGFRLHLQYTIIRSAAMTLAVVVLFGMVRQMFVHVIGF